jgi:hypothetical protein
LEPIREILTRTNSNGNRAPLPYAWQKDAARSSTLNQGSDLRT